MWTDQDLLVAVASSTSFTEVARRLGYKEYSGNGCKRIRSRCTDLQIDLSHLVGQGWSKGLSRDADERISRQAEQLEAPWDEAFGIDSPVRGQLLIERLVRAGKRKYCCERCGISEWNELPLVLQLHHLNGNPRDNRELNIQIVCPNCHSQTENWGTRNRKQKGTRQFFCTCGAKVSRKSVRCGRCRMLARPRSSKCPDVLILQADVKSLGIEGAGRKYGVSGSAVRKWLDKNVAILRTVETQAESSENVERFSVH